MRPHVNVQSWAHLGYFFRGGISIGQHYESNLGGMGHLFILSQAHKEAVESEGKVSDAFCILLGESIRHALLDQSVAGLMLDGCAFTDSKERYCLDIYHALRDDHRTKKILSELVNGLWHQLRSSSTGAKEKAKYNWFIEYHNNRLSSEQLPFPEFRIEIGAGQA